MPRYFFDLKDGTDSHADHEGLVLQNLLTARHEACEALLAIAKDHIPKETDVEQTISIAVRDESGRKLLTVALSYSEEPVDWNAEANHS